MGRKSKWGEGGGGTNRLSRQVSPAVLGNNGIGGKVEGGGGGGGGGAVFVGVLLYWNKV